MHLPLLRAAVGVVEVLVDEPVGLLGEDSETRGPLERGDGGEPVVGREVESSLSPETRHRLLCIALAAAREEARTIGRSNDDDSRGRPRRRDRFWDTDSMHGTAGRLRMS